MAKIIENATLPAVALCVVSFIDLEGVRHTVKVHAESLYEAAVLGIRLFRDNGCAPEPTTELEVEVRTSITHTITRQKVERWVNSGTSAPKDLILKERLRSLL